MSGFDRRRFLIGGATMASALSARVLAALPPGGAPRTLVLLQLSGGNDGLSTVVPWADDVYHAARPTIRVAPDEVLRLDDYRGLHPELQELHRAFEAGRLAIVEGCGYPGPNRSHFKSMDVWHTADLAGRDAGEGWVGRLARAAFQGVHQPNLVVHVGGNVPYSLHSLTHPPTSFVMPRSYRWAGDEAETEAYERAGGMEEQRPSSNLEYLRQILADGQASSAAVRRAAASYSTDVEYPSTPLGTALHDVAALIAGDIGSRILSVEYTGFDTHDNQVSRYRVLMRNLDLALGAFLADLESSEAGRETIVLAFSEFGRRVEENGAEGTDHGVAAPVLVVGPKVQGGLFGEHPSLTDLVDGDLAHTTDFRSVYATVIERWFDTDPARVLGDEFPTLDLLPA